MIKINFDGACEPNPDGTASCGWLIKKNNIILAKEGKIIGSGKGLTNNIAEYTALIKAIEALKKLDIDKEKVKICGDSNLVCNTVSKKWGWKGKNKKVWDPHKNKPHLKVLLDKVLKLLNDYDYEIVWAPREENSEADELSKKPLIEAGIVKSNT